MLGSVTINIKGSIKIGSFIGIDLYINGAAYSNTSSEICVPGWMCKPVHKKTKPA